MNKLRSNLDVDTLIKRPNKHEVKQATLTLQRFKSNSPI